MNLKKFIKKEIKKLQEQKQILNEACTCYTLNPVAGDSSFIVYDLCYPGGSMQVFSHPFCCGGSLDPNFVADHECLDAGSVANPIDSDGLQKHPEDKVIDPNYRKPVGPNPLLKRENVINEAPKCTYSFECKKPKICIKGRCRKNKAEKPF